MKTLRTKESRIKRRSTPPRAASAPQLKSTHGCITHENRDWSRYDICSALSQRARGDRVPLPCFGCIAAPARRVSLGYPPPGPPRPPRLKLSNTIPFCGLFAALLHLREAQSCTSSAHPQQARFEAVNQINESIAADRPRFRKRSQSVEKQTKQNVKNRTKDSPLKPSCATLPPPFSSPRQADGEASGGRGRGRQQAHALGRALRKQGPQGVLAERPLVFRHRVFLAPALASQRVAACALLRAK